MKITPARLSDVASRQHRADWSELNARLRSLQPGDCFSVECPTYTTLQKLRSAILTNARRIDYGPWRVSTRVNGRSLDVFLIPTE